MKLKKVVSALAAIGFGAGLALSSGPVAAGVTWFSPFTVLHDDDLDYVFDNDENGTLSTGDRLISVVEFNDSRGIFMGQGPTSFLPGELTAVADITIATVLVDGVGNQTYVFAPTGATGLLGALGAGAMVAIYSDPSPDLDVTNSNCGSQTDCLKKAGLGLTDGSSLFLTAGFSGDPDNLWISSPDNGGGLISTVEGGGAGTTFGTFNFSLTVLTNNTGQIFKDVACAPFCGPGGDGFVTTTGNGQILGGEGLNHDDWTARSKADAKFAVPEPGSLALLGAALLAAPGVFRLRKKSRKS